MRLTETRLRQIIKEEVVGMTRSRNLREGSDQMPRASMTVDSLFDLLERMKKHHDGAQFVSPPLRVDGGVEAEDQSAVYLVPDKHYATSGFGENRKRQDTDDLLLDLEQIKLDGGGDLPIYFQNPYTRAVQTVELEFNGRTIKFRGR
jgi:hypothetical protein